MFSAYVVAIHLMIKITGVLATIIRWTDVTQEFLKEILNRIEKLSSERYMFNFGKNNIQSISSKGNKNIGEE